MITKAAIFHRPKGSYAYAYDPDTLHLRIRVAKGEVKKATLRIGDPYDWAKGGGGGNLNAENAYGWVGGENIEMSLEASTDIFDFFIAKAAPEFKRSRYAFLLESDSESILVGEKKIVDITDENREQEMSNIGNFFCFPYINNIDVFSPPSWVKDAVFYQIFPERFDNGDPSNDPAQAIEWGSVDPSYDTYYGGDLQGVINRLDYLKELGINAIYFCPITEGGSNHKYDTIDYMKVDPAFGTNETFAILVEEAHARGIRIMLDAVFNHIGYHSMQWQDVLKNGEASPYKDWFYIEKFPVLDMEPQKITDKNGINYETFAFTPYMPKLNTENPVVREYLLEVGRFWAREFGIDGWRLDVANEVDHSFWREFRTELKKINPDIYILGEVWHDALPWLMGDQFDAVMNYPLTDAVVGFFAQDTMNAREFTYAIDTNLTNYPANVNEYTFNLLDSHDTARILTRCSGNMDKAKMAYAFMFLQPGATCIYYGSEIGLDGGHVPLCRKCMVWDEDKQDKDMLSFMKKLIAARKSCSLMKSSFKSWLAVDENSGLLAMNKTSAEGELIAVFNNSGNENAYTLPERLIGKEFTDILTDETISNPTQIGLAPFGFKLLKIRG